MGGELDNRSVGAIFLTEESGATAPEGGEDEGTSIPPTERQWPPLLTVRARLEILISNDLPGSQRSTCRSQLLRGGTRCVTQSGCQGVVPLPELSDFRCIVTPYAHHEHYECRPRYKDAWCARLSEKGTNDDGLESRVFVIADVFFFAFSAFCLYCGYALADVIFHYCSSILGLPGYNLFLGGRFPRIVIQKESTPSKKEKNAPLDGC